MIRDLSSLALLLGLVLASALVPGEARSPTGCMKAPGPISTARAMTW